MDSGTSAPGSANALVTPKSKYIQNNVCYTGVVKYQYEFIKKKKNPSKYDENNTV